MERERSRKREMETSDVGRRTKRRGKERVWHSSLLIHSLLLVIPAREEDIKNNIHLSTTI